MVLHEEPITDVLPIAIDGQRLGLAGIEDHQRDQLFRKLKRTVIVGTIRRERRQAVSVMVGAHEVIGRSFRSRVRAVWRVRCRFAKRGIFQSE